MKNIIVCGDSFMTPVTNFPESHFAELLSKSLGAELQCYARGGMSNAGIGVQIGDAVVAKPDLILLDVTLPYRIEFPISNKKSAGPFHITDIVYAHQESISSHYPWLNKNPSMIIDNLMSLLEHSDSPPRWNNLYKNVPGINEKISALKEYFIHLYDPMWKRQIDQWCMYAVLHYLHESGIPYLIVRDFLKVDKFKWLQEKNYIVSKIDPIYQECDALYPNFWQNNLDPGYHTPPEFQIKICNVILDHLKQWKFIG